MIFISIFTIRNVNELFCIPKPKTKGVGAFSLLLFTVLYFIAGLSVACFLLIEDPNLLLFISGLFIFLLFHTLRIFAVRSMQNNYSQYMTPVDDGTLITTKYHSKIRHPLYLFYTLEMSGLLLVKFNFITLSALAIDLLVTLIRIRKEEQLLTEKYGNAYTSYQKNTWKLIPFIC